MTYHLEDSSMVDYSYCNFPIVILIYIWAKILLGRWKFFKYAPQLKICNPGLKYLIFFTDHWKNNEILSALNLS